MLLKEQFDILEIYTYLFSVDEKINTTLISAR